MTVIQMIERGYSLHKIQLEVRRFAFSVVLKEERRVRLKGAKGRAAKRLGIHRNTVTREMWARTQPPPLLQELLAERDPPMPRKEIR